MNFTYDYFVEEWNRFWDLLGKKTTTQIVAMRAWKGLCYVAIRTEADNDKVTQALRSAQENLLKRLPYFQFGESSASEVF